MPRYGLGRLVMPDPRDRNFLMRLVMRPRRLPDDKVWTPGPVLDQGQTSSCVGHGWYGYWLSAPVIEKPDDTHQVPDASAIEIYQAAQLIDGIPLPHDGSSVRAGAQVLADPQGPLSRGGKAPITTYVWAQNADDVKHWVLGNGPVVVGTSWTEAMFQPDAKGFIRPTGAAEGGHCWLIIGYHTSLDAFVMRNSWGESWSEVEGLPGCAYISRTALNGLLRDQGEACAATGEQIDEVAVAA